MTKDKSNRISRRNLLTVGQMAPSGQKQARVCDLRKTREQAGKEAAYHLSPPRDPYLNKGQPVVNPEVPKYTSAAELLNRGNQLLVELDRQHKRLHDAVEGALKPDPQAWRSVRAAKTDYDAAYHEMTALSKRLNQLIQNETPELIRSPAPPATATFGDVVTTNAKRRK